MENCNQSDLPTSMVVGNKADNLIYGTEDVPPWPTRLLLGFQQTMVATCGVVAAPWVVSELVCAASLPLARVYLIGTTMVVTGLSTILQTILGCRLPLLQGPCFAFLPPIVALKALPDFDCPWDDRNVTEDDFTDEERTRVGLAASVTQILLGMTGVVGVLTKRIGPLTIAPLMLLLELSIVELILQKMSQHWISLLYATLENTNYLRALLLLGTFAIYLNRVQVPLPTINNGKFVWTTLPLFGMFPYLMAILSAWGLAALLTTTGVFNNTTDLPARTDTNLHVLTQAPWIRLPFPGQWGWPSFHLGVFLGFVGSTCASVVESIGDYQACARVSRQPSPPTHAINRGIFMEGVCCAIGACFGGSVSVTTYSENIGVIGITKVASRSIMIVGGVVFILLGIFTKFGALLATMPDPIIGSVLAVSLSMVGGVGLGSIQLMDCKSSRNLSILGLSVMIGLLVSGYVRQAPVNTGVEMLDQVLQIVLSIDMLVGGVTGFILDNTVSATSLTERGLMTRHTVDQAGSGKKSVCDFNSHIKKFLKKTHLRYLPIFARE